MANGFIIGSDCRDQCHEESKATFGISREKNCQQGLAMSSPDMKGDIGGR